MIVRVTGQDVRGDPMSLRGEGLLARIFQHETDHVNGTLFIDRLRAEERRKAMALIRERELGARRQYLPPPGRSQDTGSNSSDPSD
jgi:peptide deformylase